MPAVAYHCKANVMSRSQGKNAVTAVAYRTGMKLQDEWTKEIKDYTRKKGVEFVYHAPPDNSPEWAKDIQKTWNTVENVEVLANSVVGREYIVSFPHQLNSEQRELILKTFVDEEFTQKNFISTSAIHAAYREGDKRNYHAHILFHDRPIKAEGFARNKDKKVKEKSFLKQIRERWAYMVAKELLQSGYEVEAYRWKHGHEKLENQRAEAIDRGDTEYADELCGRVGTIHLGNAATALERKGIETKLGNVNREIEEGNLLRKKAHKAAAKEKTLQELKEIRRKNREKEKRENFLIEEKINNEERLITKEKKAEVKVQKKQEATAALTTLNVETLVVASNIEENKQTNNKALEKTLPKKEQSRDKLSQSSNKTTNKVAIVDHNLNPTVEPISVQQESNLTLNQDKYTTNKQVPKESISELPSAPSNVPKESISEPPSAPSNQEKVDIETIADYSQSPHIEVKSESVSEPPSTPSLQLPYDIDPLIAQEQSLIKNEPQEQSLIKNEPQENSEEITQPVHTPNSNQQSVDQYRQERFNALVGEKVYLKVRELVSAIQKVKNVKKSKQTKNVEFIENHRSIVISQQNSLLSILDTSSQEELLRVRLDGENAFIEKSKVTLDDLSHFENALVKVKKHEVQQSRNNQMER